MWYKARIPLPPDAVSPKEVVYELITGADDVGCGLAVADIRLSAKHFHKETLETYTLVTGRLKVHVGDREGVLTRAGQTVTIPVNTPHWAESIGESLARIVVFTTPAWTPEDHLLL